MKKKNTVLLVDDEPIAIQNLEYVLKKEGYAVTSSQSGPEALKLIDAKEFDLVLTDLKMEEVDGMKILERSKANWPDTEVIMITGYATLDSAVEAMKAGAYHYIAKPFKLDEVRKVTKEALEKRDLKRENTELRSYLQITRKESGIVTNNQKMKKLLEVAAQVATSDSNVVISGESGTGKELLARFIHKSSHRKNGPLLSINCGAFNEELLANELFGHEKGAFTGADTMKKGLFEACAGGTLFLDEITEMSLSMQVKLLRAIQEKEVLRIGGTTPVKVDIRFVSATNRNLQQEVNDGHFRQDLYFRINVVSSTPPPLAERKDDIPLLIQHFLWKNTTAVKKQVVAVSPEVVDILMQYDFPGNVRELENIVERGVALARGQTIEVSHLPEDLRGLVFKTYRRRDDGGIPSLEEQEKSYIEWVLEECKGNKTVASQYLGIDRVSLWRKLKRYGMDNNGG